MRKTLAQTVLPLTILTDNLGVVQGLDRGEIRHTKPKCGRTEEHLLGILETCLFGRLEKQASHGRKQETNDRRDNFLQR